MKKTICPLPIHHSLIRLERSTSLVAVVHRLCLHSSRAGGLSSAKYGTPGFAVFNEVGW